MDTLDVEGVTFVVTYRTGDPDDYEGRIAGIVREEAGEDAIGIAGHTHEILDTTKGGIRLLNPGSIAGVDVGDHHRRTRRGYGTGDLDVTIQQLEEESLDR